MPWKTQQKLAITVANSELTRCYRNNPRLVYRNYNSKFALFFSILLLGLFFKMSDSAANHVISTQHPYSNQTQPLFHRNKLLKTFGSNLPLETLDMTRTEVIAEPRGNNAALSPISTTLVALWGTHPNTNPKADFENRKSTQSDSAEDRIESSTHESTERSEDATTSSSFSGYGNRFGFRRSPGYRVDDSRESEKDEFPYIGPNSEADSMSMREKAEAELEDNLRREFVRVQMTDPNADIEYRFQRKTFSIPRQFECFSCMSLSYEDNWEYLQNMYSKPKTFTNRCNEPLIQRNIPTVFCGTVCVTLLEPNVEAGVFLGYKYIRGCEDQILRHGFNQSALRTHRFIFLDKQCKSLSRASLFNRPRAPSKISAPFYGEVELCTCFGDRCNNAPKVGKLQLAYLASVLTLFLIFQANLSNALISFLIESIERILDARHLRLPIRRPIHNAL